MAPARRVAVTVPGWPEVRSTIELIKWAESNGYTDAWFGDSGAPDSLDPGGGGGAAQHYHPHRHRGHPRLHALAVGHRGERPTRSGSCCPGAS